jgi:hypothetical protein
VRPSAAPPSLIKPYSLSAAQGFVSRVPLPQLGSTLIGEEKAEPVLGSRITCLVHASDNSAGRSHLVAGGQDGELAILDST